MSVLGIDFGSDACVIGQAGGMSTTPGRGGIDIVLNDNSKRRTPYAICTYCSYPIVPSFHSRIKSVLSENTQSLL